MKNRRGITLIETVVAIAIITVITASLLTAVTSQIKMRNRTLHTLEASCIAENVIECFVFSPDCDELEKTLKQVLHTENVLLNGDTQVGEYILTIKTGADDISVTVKRGSKTLIENLSYPCEVEK